MLDTGAQPNILKKGCIRKQVRMNQEKRIQLTGITEDVVHTLGTVEARISGIPVVFHVVPDDFPIIPQGILGSSFFTEYNACIDYRGNCVTWCDCTFPFKIKESIVIPPRTNYGLVIRILNPEIKTGYLPRLRACDGVYAGDALVTCINNKACIRIINTLDHEIEILVPALQLREVAEISNAPQKNHEITVSPEPKPCGNNEIANSSESTDEITKRSNDALSRNLLSSLDTLPTTPAPTLENNHGHQGCLPYDASRCIADLGQHSLSPPTSNIASTSNSFSNSTSSLTTISSNVLTADPKECPFPPFDFREEFSCSVTTTHDWANAEPFLRGDPDEHILSPFPLLRTSDVRENFKATEACDSLVTHCVEYSTNENGPTRNCKRKCEPIDREHRMSTLLSLLRLDHLSSEEKENIVSLVKRHSERFFVPNEYLSATRLQTHKIVTTDEVPIHHKQYRFPPVHREEITRQVQELVEGDIVAPSASPYNSPVWIVPKKPDSMGNKKWRMVIDYRKLNEKTIGDSYPLPNINDILNQLGGAKYFSVLDLASGFHQIPMDPIDAHKTAFSTPYGHYQFSRMPFGLRNAPATFQRLMDQVLTGLQGTELFVYMDDIVVHASSLKEHDVKMKKLLSRLESANLKLQPDKCEFLHHEVTYLGHIIGENGVRPDPKKLAAVRNFPTPKNLKNIRQFLGLAGYYRRFIADFSRTASPLSNMLKKGAAFKWTRDAQHAFETLRESLCKEPILQYPDFEREFILTTDASDFAIGGVLSQGDVGQDLPIGYASRVLNPAEKNYSTIEKELLAIVYCANHFRPYLYGRTFVLVTDHQPLTWLHRVKDPTSRLVRWRLKLEEYNYRIIYKKGISNSNADALSRNPPLEIAPNYLSVTIVRKKRRLSLEGPPSISYASDSDDELPRKLPSAKLALERGEQPPDFNINSEGSPPSPSYPPYSSTLLEQSQSLPATVSSETAEEPRYNLRAGKTVTFAEQPDETNPEGEPEEGDTPDASGNLGDAESIPSSILEEDLELEPSIDEPLCSIRETSSPFSRRNDNLVVMATTSQQPFDKGASELSKIGRLPPLDDMMLGRARVFPSIHPGRHLIILPVKERPSIHIDHSILNECFSSLLDVVTELCLPTVSIAKTKTLDTLSWDAVMTSLRTALAERPIKITICNDECVAPPTHERMNIIRENHESASGGHKGVTKTYLRIRKSYRWSHMKAQIQDYIRRCRTCQLQKLVRRKTRQPMILTDTPGQAFDKVAMDIVGPFERTERGNSYILTMQDLLTKYSVYAPLPDFKAETTAAAFTNFFICRFGCPRSILTDQGTNFTSGLMRHVARKFRIKQIRTTAFHPQSNGSLERSHHVLVEYLKCFTNQRDSWDELIERASFSYNTSVHEGTGFTPHELIYGRPARLPSRINHEEEPETYAHHLTNLIEEISDLQTLANANLQKAKLKSKLYYDRRANPENFNIGDSAFMLNEQQKGKFSSEYTGPYKIIKTLDNGNIKIKLRRERTRVVHVNRLRRAFYDEPG